MSALRRRPSVLSRQRVAPRGAGLPRRGTGAGVTFAVLAITSTVLYGLAVYGALALWRAL